MEIAAYAANGARRIAGRVRFIARHDATRFGQKVGRNSSDLFDRLAFHPIHRCACRSDHGQAAVGAVAGLLNDVRLRVHAREYLHGDGAVLGRTRHANGIHPLGHTGFRRIGHKRQSLIGIALNAPIVVGLVHISRANIRPANRRPTKHVFRFHMLPLHGANPGAVHFSPFARLLRAFCAS